MKTITDLIEDVLYERKVMALKYSKAAKPPPRGKYWSNLWDVYSPKLNRDITLYSDLEYYTWVYIESDAKVIGFCPQPVYAHNQYNGQTLSSLLDF